MPHYMEQMIVEYDYYSDKIHPRCLAEFQSRVKHLYKDYRVTVICQVKEHTVNKHTKLQVWLLHPEMQEWLNDAELKDVILDNLKEKFEFCVINY